MIGVFSPMRGGVPVGRVVATAHMAASHTHPQMYPRSTDPEAVFAAIAGRGHLSDGVEVRTRLSHRREILVGHPSSMGSVGGEGAGQAVQDQVETELELVGKGVSGL